MFSAPEDLLSGKRRTKKEGGWAGVQEKRRYGSIEAREPGGGLYLSQGGGGKIDRGRHLS